MSDKYERFDDDARETVINWKNRLQQIEDSYEEHRGVVHGIQKDAVQNGWDARDSEPGNKWKFEFELVEENDTRFFVMRDYGTTGLTGRILSAEEYEGDLPPEERWARFESLAFTKDNSGTTLGSRGQGKFIFVAGSKDDVIVYDSLRPDGSYRAGMRRVEKTSSPVNAWDGDEGHKNFHDVTGGHLDDLNSVGTRVVIVDPIDDLVDSLRDGTFLEHIGETWWEIIAHKDATIEVTVDGTTETATLPDEFRLLDEDTDDRKVWIEENDETSDGWNVERLHLVHAPPDDVPEELTGVCIQRGGMKIETIDPRRRVPEDIADGIYGYILLDEEAEKELHRAENPEHYGFSYRFAAPKDIQNYIRDKIETFAREKLNWTWNDEVEEAQRHQEAERKAMNAVNRVTREFDLTPSSDNDDRFDDDDEDRNTSDRDHDPDPVRLTMPSITFPREDSLRVDYGEKITDIRLKGWNDTATPIDVQIRIDLMYSEMELDTQMWEETIPAEDTIEVGPFDQSFSRVEFPREGKYTFQAQLVSLEDHPEAKRGEIIDMARQNIYLEVEPPAQGGIFSECQPVEDKDRRKSFGWILRENGDRVFQYNLAHPEQKKVYKDEDELADYLFRIMMQELMQDEIERGSMALFDDTDPDDPVELTRRYTELLGEFSHSYYGGSD